MTNFTNKNIGFLSNRELEKILKSLLGELDLVASSGAHRSTTYLAVSAIEGLFGELLKLLNIQPIDVPGAWPNNKNSTTPKASKNLKLHEKEKILNAAGVLPTDFEKLYAPVRVFRNYMHPDRELKERTPISQSVGQAAVACLNALIEKYSAQRFAANHIWRLEHGLAQVPSNNTIQMIPNPGRYGSLLVSDLPAERFRQMTFRVFIPPGAIFNLVYNYSSLDKWRAARVEGRERADARGKDNGLIVCWEWGAWANSGRYTNESEPDPKLRQHEIQLVLDPPGNLNMIVDGVPLELEACVDWEFDPQGRIGFMTELGLVSVVDLVLQTN
jgi:hypothetical protein